MRLPTAGVTVIPHLRKDAPKEKPMMESPRSEETGAPLGDDSVDSGNQDSSDGAPLS